jgi:hypothetical protein
MSARIISLTLSKSHSSKGVIWKTHFAAPGVDVARHDGHRPAIVTGRCDGFQVDGFPVP